MRATLSIPLVVGEGDGTRSAPAAALVGANVYSRTAAAFNSFDEELMSLYTTAASQATGSAQRWQCLLELPPNSSSKH